jgi:AcrR family transcriptional regulator
VSGFQRARRPEQVRARREAILDTATAMLRQRPVADISLRELSDRVGLAKSNVLRYFDSREAIFLEVLDREWTAWLDDMDDRLPANTARHHATGRDTAGHNAGGRDAGDTSRTEGVARIVADTLVERPLLCELISAMAGVLERNISLEFARDFKRRATVNADRLAGLVRSGLPRLPPAAAEQFAAAVFVIVAGLWPYANPTDAVATAMAEHGSPPPMRMFADGLADGLANQLVGLVVRTATPDLPT